MMLAVEIAIAAGKDPKLKDNALKSVSASVASFTRDAAIAQATKDQDIAKARLKADTANTSVNALPFELQAKVDNNELSQEQANLILTERKNAVANIAPYLEQIATGKIPVSEADQFALSIGNKDQREAILAATQKKTGEDAIAIEIAVLEKQDILKTLSDLQSMVEQGKITTEMAQKVVEGRRNKIDERTRLAQHRIESGEIEISALAGDNNPLMKELTGDDPAVEANLKIIVESKLAADTLKKIVYGAKNTAGETRTPQEMLNAMLDTRQFSEYDPAIQEAIKASLDVEIADYNAMDATTLKTVTARESDIKVQNDKITKLEWKQWKYGGTQALAWLAAVGVPVATLLLWPSAGVISAIAFAVAGLIGVGIERGVTKSDRLALQAEIDKLTAAIPDMTPVKLAAERDLKLRRLSIAQRCQQVGATILAHKASKDPQAQQRFVAGATTRDTNDLQGLFALLQQRPDFSRAAMPAMVLG
jgi:hypothetical protein